MATLTIDHPGMTKTFFDIAFHRAMLADLSLMTTSRPGVFAVSSSTSDEVDYLVTRETCSCEGARRHGRCYHRAMVCGWLDVMRQTELGSARYADDRPAA